MDLLLWRHAEAEDGYPDLKRKLTARGEKQAAQMAQWIKTHAPTDLRILVSPAIRCQQTAKALGLPFETDPRIGTDSNAERLLTAAGWPEGKNASAVLIVGHQPTLGQTAALLLSGTEDDWTVKKGAVWWITSRTHDGHEDRLITPLCAQAKKHRDNCQPQTRKHIKQVVPTENKNGHK